MKDGQTCLTKENLISLGKIKYMDSMVSIKYPICVVLRYFWRQIYLCIIIGGKCLLETCQGNDTEAGMYV